MRAKYAVPIGLMLAWAVAGGCSARPASWSAGSPDAQQGAAGHFTVPSPAGILAAPGAIHQTSNPLLYIHGNDFDAGHSQRVEAVDNAAVFAPDWASRTTHATGLAYAVYWFNLKDYAGQSTLKLEWGAPPAEAGQLWLGFSNWETGRWDWRSAPPGDVLSLGAAGYAPYTAAGDGTLLVAVLLLGEAPCTLAGLHIGPSAAGGWRMAGHDAQHTRRSEAAGPVSGALRWQFRTTGAGFCFSTPVQGADGTLYASTGSALHAITSAGTRLWECFVPQSRTPAAAGAHGIYVPTCDGKLYCVRHNGEVAWRFEGASAELSDVTVDSAGTAYFGSQDHKLYAVKPDGALRWTYSASERVSCQPGLGPAGEVYFGCADGMIYALNSAGALKWNYAAESYIFQSCRVGPDSTIYFPTDAGLLALRPDGTRKWNHPWPDPSGYHSGSAPAFGSDGTLYFNLGGIGIEALTPDNVSLWVYDIALINTAVPSIAAGGAVYCPTRTGVTILSADGTLQRRLTCGQECGVPLVRSDGGIHLPGGGIGRGALYAISATGTLQWQYTCGMWTGEAVFDAAGTAYVCSGRKICAIATDGALEWEDSLAELTRGAPAVGMDGTVYCAGYAGLAALDHRGDPLWLYPGSYVEAPVLARNDTLYAVRQGDYCGSSQLVTLTPGGELQWVAGVSGEWVDRGPVLAGDGTAYVEGVMDILTAFGTAGDERWVTYTDFVAAHSPAVGPDGRLHFSAVAQGYGLSVLDADGNPQWAFTGAGGILSSPALGEDGRLYANCKDGLLYAVDATGVLCWTAAAGGTSSPAIDASGVLYAGGQDYRLHAFSPDGRELWVSEPVGGEFSDLAIGNFGEVVAGCGDGFVRAYGGT